MNIALATRRSPLAMVQAEEISAALRERHPDLEVELVAMSTRGDEMLDRALAPLGGKGLFIKALEAALESGRARIAVHSLKDLPAVLEPGFALAAVPARHDPRDVLISRHGPDVDSLPRGARVGTASLRRQAQLLAVRPDLDVVTLRGSVQTRLARLDAGELDATVLAAAGLARLGIDRGTPIDPSVMVPASGQGALGLEVIARDEEAAELALGLEDAGARVVAAAERGFCRALGATCASPVAAYATVDGGRVRLVARVAATDGSRMLEESGEVDLDAAAALGEKLAKRLLGRGAGAFITPPGD